MQAEAARAGFDRRQISLKKGQSISRMHKLVSFNGELRDAAETTIPAVSSAALYGAGVFTTIAIRSREPFLWDKHLRRLRSDADRLGLDLASISDHSLLAELRLLLDRNEVDTGKARITVFDTSPGPFWHYDTGMRNSVLILTSEAASPRNGLTLEVSRFSVNHKAPTSGIKSCNYLENVVAFNEARSRGFDEAVRVNTNGHITSACVANLIWKDRKTKKLYTPALETGCIEGTTREFVLESLDITERVCRLEEMLDEAESMVITSAGVMAASVSSVGEREFVRGLDEILDLFV